MIVWLASYPRSGNTLLRTILFQCFGIESYSDEVDESVRARVALTDSAKSAYGQKDIDSDWNEFYAKASSSNQLIAIKTHLPPRDFQKTIYVVRDGRQALQSYQKFHRDFLADRQLSLLQLVLGQDYYGGWSEHFEAWNNNRPMTLLVRFEDLVIGKASTMEALATHLELTGTFREWHNPFDRLNKSNPTFFREGKQHWEANESWSGFVDALFFHLHGKLMRDLGYANSESISNATRDFLAEQEELAHIICESTRQIRELRKVCDDRLQVIDELGQVARERLEVINMLDAELKRRG